VEQQLQYRLEETPRTGVLALSSLQWLMFMLANVITVPIVLGNAFGMGAEATALLVTRTFFVCGLVGFLQAVAGHRYAILEGPAGMWWGVFIVLIQMARQTGLPMHDLQRQLEMGLLIAGAMYVLLSVSGGLRRIQGLFTPVVTGTFLVLLSLQLSKSMVEGLLGIGFGNQQRVLPRILFLSLALVALTAALMLKGRGILKSLAVLISLAIGWIVYGLLGLLPSVPSDGKIFAVPQVFAWGAPEFHWGIVITSAITALILLSNLVASVQAFGSAIQETPSADRFSLATLVSGVGTGLSAMFSTVGLVPLTSASSLVSLTGIASRVPFLIASGVLAVLGFFPQLGQYAATLPAPVGYAVLFAVFGQLLGFGLKDYGRLTMDQRNIFVISMPLLAGVGTMFVAESAWEYLPPLLGYLMGNGLIIGVVLVILLEHVVFRHSAARGASS